jgi:nucleotidyltransferase substrate binding protein (TIGR01987 family)
MSEFRRSDAFGKALAKLREFVALPMANDRDQAGVIQAFEFTFEQCWKAFQRVAVAQGLTAASPRQALQAAGQLGLIADADEDAWLIMLRDRNMTTHLYHEQLSREIADRVVRVYVPLLDGAHAALLRETRRLT